MYQLIFKIFNMGITATFMALAVIFLRLILKGAPRWISYVLWSVVLFRLMCRDMEMSCDERVARELDPEGKAGYSTALLRLAIKRPIFSGSPLAFGESGAKERVKNILNYKSRPSGSWPLR